MNPDQFKSLLRTEDAAMQLGLSPRTLETLRLKGGGPVYVKLGRSVRYQPDAIEAWINTRRTRSTSDAND